MLLKTPPIAGHRFANVGEFRARFANLTGVPLDRLQNNAALNAWWVETPLGSMISVTDKSHLYLLEFLERKRLPREMSRLFKDAKGSMGIERTAIHEHTQAALNTYFSGADATLDLPLAPTGTVFERTIWDALRGIPGGKTRSYSQLAIEMGRPQSTRAVARANGANPIAIVIPCHRLIGANGALTGYGGGLWRKEWLIKFERTQFGSPKT